MMMWLLSILMMVLGFGFVVFWHELGHFLGARRAGIRVEQFAVGMGPAICSYRKGIGLKLGNTQAEFDRRVKEELARQGHTGEPTVRQQYDAAKAVGMGETEYRLAWLPIGGYVKPTGQDDLRPAVEAAADDPHSYAAATVGHRMVLISAGVIMNVILAGILFFVLFRFVGFEGVRPIVGQVQSNSPAAEIGLRAGDELVELNGHTLHDFTKILMNVALLPSDRDVPLTIRRDGELQTFSVRPRKTDDNAGMLAFGIGQAPQLRGIDPDSRAAQQFNDALAKLPTVDPLIIRPGERIVQVNHTPVTQTDYAVLDRAVQQAFGQPVTLTIESSTGTRRTASFVPSFAPPFNREPLAFMDLEPRTEIGSVGTESPAHGKLKEKDVILSVRRATLNSAPLRTPTTDAFRKFIAAAGSDSAPIVITVQRGDEVVEIPPIVPSVKIGPGTYGLSVGLNVETARAVVGDVREGSAAAQAALPPGATLTAVNGQPVTSWHDVHRAIISLERPGAIKVEARTPRGDEAFEIDVPAQTLAQARNVRYASDGALQMSLGEWTKVRETDSAFTALAWGVGETRDLILQGYLTIQRVFGGSVPASNMSGPVGIFKAGTMFAQKGGDWFIWFLAVISANLAVVNFLPIPILDGWHFLGLLKEKVTGKPLSDRVQVVAQYIGLALILSLLVFVTFNDLTRW